MKMKMKMKNVNVKIKLIKNINTYYNSILNTNTG